MSGSRNDVSELALLLQQHKKLVALTDQYNKEMQDKAKRKLIQSTEGSLSSLRIQGQSKFAIALVNTLKLDERQELNPATVRAKIKAFQNEFKMAKDFLTGSNGSKYKSQVANILLSIFTLGIYAGVRAIDSKISRGYFAFWKQRKTVFVADTQASLDAVNAVKPSTHN